MAKDLSPQERIARQRARRGATSPQSSLQSAQSLSLTPSGSHADLMDKSAPIDASDKSMAEAWARSTGLVDIPAKPHKFNGWICFMLAWFWVVPAIIYYFWCESRASSYGDAIKNAVAQWRAHGSPDPFAQMAVGVATQEVVKESSLSERLNELLELKDKGVISEDEFLAAKKKILDI